MVEVKVCYFFLRVCLLSLVNSHSIIAAHSSRSPLFVSYIIRSASRILRKLNFYVRPFGCEGMQLGDVDRDRLKS